MDETYGFLSPSIIYVLNAVEFDLSSMISERDKIKRYKHNLNIA
jgi:hypothetical protein